jgi:hypothetical protein
VDDGEQLQRVLRMPVVVRVILALRDRTWFLSRRWGGTEDSRSGWVGGAYGMRDGE